MHLAAISEKPQEGIQAAKQKTGGKHMKKTLAFVLLAAMLIGMLAGCGSGGTAQTTAAAENETKATLETSAMNVEATGTKGGNVTMGPDSQKKTMVAVASNPGPFLRLRRCGCPSAHPAVGYTVRYGNGRK